MDVVAFLLFEELNIAERRLGHRRPRRVLLVEGPRRARASTPRSTGSASSRVSGSLRLRRLGGLDGHPDVGVPGIEANSGSLGMGISKGRGIAWAKRHLGRGGRVVVMVGDGELQEGQNYEGAAGGRARAPRRADGRRRPERAPVGQADGRDRRRSASSRRGSARSAGTSRPATGTTSRQLRDAFASFRDGRRRAEGARRAHDQGQGRLVHGAPGRARARAAARTAGTPALPTTSRSSARSPSSSSASPSGSRRSASSRSSSSRSEDVDAASRRRSRASPSRAPARAARRSRTSTSWTRTATSSSARRRARRPRRPRRRPRLRLPRARLRARVSRTGSSSAGSPSRTWSRPPRGSRVTACCPVVNSFASFLASRANEQIYNQASERTKVVYALHYAGLIPAGPGKSHQSVRDISLLAALPDMTIVQPASAEETRALLRWAVEEARRGTSRSGSRSGRRRGGSSSPDGSQLGRGRSCCATARTRCSSRTGR